MARYELSVKRMEQFVNWNWIGLIAAGLSVLVTAYNIKQYTDALRRGEKGGVR